MSYGDVMYITEREQGGDAAQDVIAPLDQLSITVVEADRALTFAAHLKANKAIAYAMLSR